MISLQSKLFKPCSDSTSEYFVQKTNYGNQIKSIPIIYKKIGYEGDPKLISKISIKGYKCLSRVVASGEYTVDILNKFRKVSSLKQIRRLEFDPYFCETSALKPLCKVLAKFRRLLSSLTLIPCKTGLRDEARYFPLIMARLKKIAKFKIEIRNNSGIDSRDFEHLTKGGKGFYSLKSLNLSIGWSKDVSRKITTIASPFRNSHKIEEVKFHVCFSHSEPSEPSDKVEESPKKNKTVISKTLKSLSFKFAFKTGWASYFDGRNPVQGFHDFLQSMPTWVNPVHLSFTFNRSCASVENIKAFANVLPKLANLKYLFLEFNNNKLAEFELLILAKAFVDCQQIEKLTFKYIDNVIIPIVDIFQFITIMANHSSCPKFDLFFRKLFYQEWQTNEAKRKLEELQSVQGINYVLTKRSIHIQRTQPI